MISRIFCEGNDNVVTKVECFLKIACKAQNLNYKPALCTSKYMKGRLSALLGRKRKNPQWLIKEAKEIRKFCFI